MGVLFWFLSSQPPGTCVGAQALGVPGFPCTAWPFPQGCLPALLPSSPQPLYPCSVSYCFCHLSYKLLSVQPESWFSFFSVLFHKVHQDVNQGSCCRTEQFPFPSLCPHIPPLLCHSSVDACHTLHVSQLNECNLHQIL